ncbi:MAG: integration host factor subunit alpha [Myxococcales bacterium]|nr:integration host factor subunit alpha [Myxococcales bacterium]
MTKADIVERVYSRMGGFTRRQAQELVESVFDLLKQSLEEGEKVKVSGFGNFVVRDKSERPGLNPRTKVKITLPPRRVVRFKPSPVLKKQLNPT